MKKNIYRRINIISKAQNILLSLITKEIQIIKFMFLAFQISTLFLKTVVSKAKEKAVVSIISGFKLVNPFRKQSVNLWQKLIIFLPINPLNQFRIDSNWNVKNLIKCYFQEWMSNSNCVLNNEKSEFLKM